MSETVNGSCSDQSKPLAGAWTQGRDQVVDRGAAWRALSRLKRNLGVTAHPEPRVGRYVLADCIGRGSFGRVYRAHDPELGRTVAIKAVTLGGHAIEHARRIVRGEAQTLARLSHRNVVSVYDVLSAAMPVLGGTGRRGEEQSLFIVMELVAGQTLAEWTQQRRRSVAEVTAAYIQAAEGLSAAHRAEVLHRDFKPGNVMRQPDGRVVVLDFGLATLPSAVNHSVLDLPTVGDGITLPSVAEVGLAGTPAYMSPEQHEGRTLSATSDIFAFGASLYEGLFGERPYVGQQAEALWRAKIGGPPKFDTRRIGRQLATVITRALAPRPSQRWSSMEELCEALRRTQRRPRRLAPITLAAVGGLTVSAFAAASETPDDGCGHAAASLQTHWTAEREAVREGLATKRSAAATAATLRSIDGYVDGWTQTYGQTCHTQQRADTDRVQACLRQASDALQTRLKLLRDAPRQLSRFDSVLARLPSGSECGTAEIQRLQPVPSDARSAALVGELRHWIATHGYGPDDVAEIPQRLRQAQRTDHLPTRASVALHAGYLFADAGRHAEAFEVLEAAYSDGVAGGADRIAMRASTALLGLDPTLLSEAGARRWSAISLSLADRLDRTDRTRAAIYANYSQALSFAGRFEEAKQVAALALPYAEHAPAHDGHAVHVLFANGLLALYTDQYDAAAALFEQSAQRALAANVAPAMAHEIGHALAGAYRYAKRHRHAEAVLRELLDNPAVNDEARGRFSLTLALVLGDDPSRLDDALALVDRTAANVRAAFGADGMAYANTLSARGQLLIKAGRLDQARAAYERARNIHELLDSVDVSRSQAVAEGLHNVAQALAERDNPGARPL